MNSIDREEMIYPFSVSHAHKRNALCNSPPPRCARCHPALSFRTAVTHAWAGMVTCVLGSLLALSSEDQSLIILLLFENQFGCCESLNLAWSLEKDSAQGLRSTNFDLCVAIGKAPPFPPIPACAPRSTVVVDLVVHSGAEPVPFFLRHIISFRTRLNICLL